MLIHIGYHKTGTSFLQRNLFFCDPPDHFFAPWTVVSGEAVEHFVLTHPCRFDPAAVRAEFEARIAGNGRALVPLISHQDLCGYALYGRYYGHEVAMRLHQTFPTAKILITIREQKSLLRSLYSQYVRQDGEWPIETFIGTGAERPGHRPICRLDHFEYDLLADCYAQLFGTDEVLVLPYEILKSDPIKFQQCIYEFAGISGAAPREFKPENVGFGALSLRLMRTLNKVVQLPPDWNGEWKNVPLTVRTRNKLCKIVNSMIPKSWHQREEKRLRAFVNSRTAGYFKSSNQRLQRLCKFDLAALGYDM